MPVLRQLVWLWLGLLLLASLAVFYSPRMGLTLLWGVSVCLVPTLLFAKLTEKRVGTVPITHVLRSFNRAESAKFVFTAGLFTAVFIQAEKVFVPVFFMVFIATQVLSLVVIARAESKCQ